MFGDPEGDYFLQQHVADLQARRPFADFVQWINRPRGMVCISTSGKPRYDGQGRFIVYIGVGRDATEEQDQPRRLEEMKPALAAAPGHASGARASQSCSLAIMSHVQRLLPMVDRKSVVR